MKIIVKCPYCGESFDRASEDYIKGIEIFPNRYFHPNCYNLALTTNKKEWPEYKNKIQLAGNELKLWADICYDFLERDIKIKANYVKIRQQLESFNKSRTMKYEGMYKTLVYCYKVKHIDKTKAEGGIGIVQLEYSNAYEYFSKQDELAKNLLDTINAEIDKKKEVLTQQHRQPGKARKKKFDLQQLAGME